MRRRKIKSVLAAQTGPEVEGWLHPVRPHGHPPKVRRFLAFYRKENAPVRICLLIQVAIAFIHFAR
ncbi:hypothetical protein FHS76_000563 [Ochrobactrum daejeonense]|uniref:Uncharacterized protein n=1 Tax=Brucella daejeonensis TaxID=659015 RepID=A0A7W9AUA8_9HYPH|nr:hypothetical protein [Brucella daejeonensis]